MCGIFGVIAGENSELHADSFESTFCNLMRLSETRGKEAAGIALLAEEVIHVYKQATSPSDMLRTKEFRRLFSDTLSSRRNANTNAAIAAIGHSRLVTNGTQCLPENNQPVVAAKMVGIHNGIIVNEERLWTEFSDLTRNLDTDTEIILQLTRHFYEETGSIARAIRDTFGKIEGVANVALLLQDFDQLLLATNNGSLYLCVNPESRIGVFASEEHVLKKLIWRKKLAGFLDECPIVQIAPGSGCLMDLKNITIQMIPLDPPGDAASVREKNGVWHEVVDVPAPSESNALMSSLAPVTGRVTPEWFLREFERNAQAVANLRRCKICVHPETLPFVDLDEHGVCAYCRNYTEMTYLGHEALEELVAPYRRVGGRPDCLVPLSGGRDSCYALHYMKKELNMNPIAFTYDWGMVTDLARRNSSRLCAKLGVEHIIVSADITRKREYIRKNVNAWMRQPDLGVIPLFMAGDKQYFYHAEKLKKRYDIEIMVLATNRLERTDFKHGFCGVSGGGVEGNIFRLSWLKNLQLVLYYAKAYLRNPAYINASLADTISAYASYYLIPHSYLFFDHYIRWNEEEVVRTLVDEYNWERAHDTKSTWRIGDGTASFYNYIYYTIAGFSENDTFRSNQVREGTLTRAEALARITEENVPRYDSMGWYCDTIGVDLDECIRVINSVPKCYPVL